ncbi:Gfo/Idh/MocA family oxidoreductase [Rubellimicrobium rubrum]|uniref:Gfo/Idh/MocA family oxidoreductase n=1 Tax=Rubellimicrobium rubrum TaxID=2585369 RepID=A0A5C4N6L5_9RHOB|nr:Gfo/Idh/MocA family oxidoreductase [Rubellimicrobium rubrum]TNC52343.1 Gfo/Idh/MocA family oxidoreductase [Rubellimicrobium rubrum]
MLRAVMVGCGAMSNGWLRAIRDTETLSRTVEMVGFVDLDPGLARTRADEYGWTQAQAGRDLGAMLAELRPDLVFDIVVPPARRGVVETALNHGCHVLSEKPMATSLAEAERLIDLAQAAGRLHGIVQNRRWLPGIRRARSLLASGALGDLTAVHCDFFIGAHFGGFRDAMEHVLLLDMAIHTFDAARYLTGLDATGVYCREVNPKGSWYAHGATADALFDLTSGATMTYRGSWCAEGLRTAWEASWRVIGTRGTLLWDGNEGFRAERVAENEGFLRAVEEVEVPPLSEALTEGHAGVIHDFVEAVRLGRKPLTPGTDNIRSLAMVLGAIESAETSRRVAIETLKEAA